MSQGHVSKCLVEGNVAAITGASSGIGRAVARYCAERRMKVFLADVDEKELEEAVQEVKALAKSADDVCGIPTDVSKPESVEQFKVEVLKKAETVHFLMNNAGVGTGGGALEELSKWQRTMGVNAWGPIHGCQAFLPVMKEKGQPGLVVNTGSKQGITCPPGNLAYNASKAVVKVYTEGLQYELRQEASCQIEAALLVPGWVNTSIFLKTMRANAEDKKETFDVSKVPFHEAKPAGGAWTPKEVVDFMIRELEKGRFYIMCPDNDVDRETDNLRMTWAMQDITQDRPPLSRWHPEYKDSFADFLAANKSASS
jgi:NAD(P)-dependent dehydrogenase (short-subunit alcohol dehydrogenase family)